MSRQAIRTILRPFFTPPVLVVAGAFQLGYLYTMTSTLAFATDVPFMAKEVFLEIVYMLHSLLGAIVMDALHRGSEETPILGPIVFFICGMPVSLLYGRALVELYRLARARSGK